MKKTLIIFLIVLVLGSLFVACAENKEHSEIKTEKSTVSESKESHARDYNDGPGEEDGTAIAMGEKFAQTKNGVKLILAYNEEKSAFVGSVENITEKTLQRVRVEIHLSNGKELGPTTPVVLTAGEVRKVQLNAAGEKFESWNAHAEIGSTEHRKNEHGSRESGEHEGEHR
ncbi:MAG: hypothetical protein KAU44_03660 [Candidatus Marinimicrobia bacterium]|nr:hypothetical protein [Candidatus Neomarinimicrobiota bacterium]